MVDFNTDFQAQSELVPQPKFQPATFQPSTMGQHVQLPDFKTDYSMLDPILKPNPKLDLTQFQAPAPEKKPVQRLNSADFNLDGQSAAPSAQLQASAMINAPGTVTQQFGNPNADLYGLDKSGKAITHRGTDIAVPKDTPIASPSAGNWVVNDAVTGGYNTGYGNYVKLTNLDTGETMQFSHLDKVLVKPGQKVTGSVVGLSGSTGRSTGNHVDIEYSKDGKLQSVLTSPYRKYLGLTDTAKEPGAKGGGEPANLVSDFVAKLRGFLSQLEGGTDTEAQAIAAQNVANKNLDAASTVSLKQKGWNADMGVPTGQGKPTSYKELTPDERKLIVKNSINLAGGVVGSLQPVDRAKNLIAAANIAQSSPDLNKRLAAIEMLRKEAEKQLTPQELEKAKDLADDVVVKKVHQRILQEGEVPEMRVIPGEAINDTKSTLHDIKKIKITNIENPAQFDNPKNLSTYDREAIDYLKNHPEELNKPINLGSYGKADKMGKITHFVEDGQHRLQALKELGVKEVDAIVDGKINVAQAPKSVIDPIVQQAMRLSKLNR